MTKTEGAEEGFLDVYQVFSLIGREVIKKLYENSSLFDKLENEMGNYSMSIPKTLE